MKTSQEIGHKATPDASEALAGFEAAELLEAARFLAGTRWVRLSQALAVHAWNLELGACGGVGAACRALGGAGASPLGNTGTTTVGSAQ